MCKALIKAKRVYLSLVLVLSTVCPCLWFFDALDAGNYLYMITSAQQSIVRQRDALAIFLQTPVYNCCADREA